MCWLPGWSRIRCNPVSSIKNLKMGKPKEVNRKAPEERIGFEKILGECHDGEDYKLLMNDGTIKQVPKVLVNGKTFRAFQRSSK